MNLSKFSVASLALATVFAITPTVFASPVGVDGGYGSEWTGVTPLAIPGGSSSNGNFGSPDPNGNVPYNIYLRDDGSYLYVLLTTTDPSAASADFANLYFDTVASTSGTGSDLGFEIENDRAFIPGGSGYTDLTGTGDLTYAMADNSGTYGIEAAITNSFFLDDPLGMGFATTPDGTLVSLHLSQTFGYGVVGGSGNYAAPAELGDVVVSAPASATPEPSSLALLGTGLVGIAGIARRRFGKA